MKKHILPAIAVVVLALLCGSIVAMAWHNDKTPTVSEEVISSHLIYEYDTPLPDYVHVISIDENENENENEGEATQTAGAALKAASETPVTKATPAPVPRLASDHDIELIARTIWGEAEGVQSKAEQAAVAWCILNRVDKTGDTIESVVLAPAQFYCRTWDDTVPDYFMELAQDVVHRWEQEHAGYTDVGRTLPPTYLYFIGDGSRNHFTVEWQSNVYWNWSFPDPYTN